MGTGSTSLHEITIAHNEANGKKALLVAPAELVSTFAEEYATEQSAVAIIEPGAGCKINLRSVFCTTDADSGTISLDFVTSEKKVFRMYATKTNNVFSGDINLVGAAGEALSLTTTTSTDKVFIIVNYTTCE